MLSFAGVGRGIENYVLHPADGAALQPDLDAMRMCRGTGQNLLHDAAGQFPGPLVFFLDNLHLKPLVNVFSVRHVHTLKEIVLIHICTFARMCKFDSLP